MRALGPACAARGVGSCAMVGFWASRESRAFEAAVAKATSPMIPAGHEDIAQNLEVCDQVRAKAVPPQEAARVLQQRLTDPTPTSRSSPSAYVRAPPD